MDLTSLLNRIPVDKLGFDKLRPLAANRPVVLEIDLARGVLSSAPDNPVAALRAMNAPTMKALREGLREAGLDENVVGLFVHAGVVPLSLAQADELADLVRRFGVHKPTLAFGESFGEVANDLASYKIASACQQVWLQPSGQVGIGGIHLGITLVRGLFDKIGVDPQFSQRHEYKTAAEQISGNEISQPNREMMQSIANSLTTDLVETVARRRKLEVQQVWDAVNASPLTPEDAQQRGLVDRVGYRDEAMAYLLDQWEAEPDDLRFVHRWHAAKQQKQAVKALVDRNAAQVAVVTIKGGIVNGRGRPPGMGDPEAGADMVCEQLRAAERDEKVKAVVLRVDSPGGSAVASDTIWRAVHCVRESGRPVVASMGDYAASGGYYAAMAADEIVALPSTLTGSIGVFGGKLVTQRLFEKLGLLHEGISSGGRADWMASDRYFGDDDWQLLDQWLDRVYEDFTTKAAVDRQMALGDLQRLARGRVWTGREAAANGLVDHLGGMELAVERACQLAELDRRRIHLRPMAHQGMIERFRPVESSESVAGPTAALQLPLLDRLQGLGPEQRLLELARLLGMRTPGVLSLGWTVELG